MPLSGLSNSAKSDGILCRSVVKKIKRQRGDHWQVGGRLFPRQKPTVTRPIPVDGTFTQIPSYGVFMNVVDGRENWFSVVSACGEVAVVGMESSERNPKCCKAWGAPCGRPQPPRRDKIKPICLIQCELFNVCR